MAKKYGRGTRGKAIAKHRWLYGGAGAIWGGHEEESSVVRGTSIMHVTIAPDFTNIGGRFVFLPLLRSIYRCRVAGHSTDRPV